MSSGAGFGRAVTRAREKRGWPLTELARRMGVNHSVVSRIEAGATEPTLTTYKALCAQLPELIAEAAGGRA